MISIRFTLLKTCHLKSDQSKIANFQKGTEFKLEKLNIYRTMRKDQGYGSNCATPSQSQHNHEKANELYSFRMML